MAKVCYVTGRKAQSGNNRSHAVNKTKRSFGANLQKVRILVDGKPKKYGFLLVLLNLEKLNVFNFSIYERNKKQPKQLLLLRLFFCLYFPSLLWIKATNPSVKENEAVVSLNSLLANEIGYA